MPFCCKTMHSPSLLPKRPSHVVMLSMKFSFSHWVSKTLTTPRQLQKHYDFIAPSCSDPKWKCHVLLHLDFLAHQKSPKKKMTCKTTPPRSHHKKPTFIGIFGLKLHPNDPLFTTPFSHIGAWPREFGTYTGIIRNQRPIGKPRPVASHLLFFSGKNQGFYLGDPPKNTWLNQDGQNAIISQSYYMI